MAAVVIAAVAAAVEATLAAAEETLEVLQTAEAVAEVVVKHPLLESADAKCVTWVDGTKSGHPDIIKQKNITSII